MGRDTTDVFIKGALEIVAHDPGTQRRFVTNGHQGSMDVLDLSKPWAIARRVSLVASEIFAAATFEPGGFTHIEVHNGILAAGLTNADPTGKGRVVFVDADTLNVINTVAVGVLPDNVSFSKDGDIVMTADEGEQVDENEDGNPPADPKAP